MSFTISKYIFASSCFNLLLKAGEIWDAKLYRYTTNKTTDMLLGEKFILVTYAAISGPVILPLKFPFYCENILNKIDIYMKGHKPIDYGLVPTKKTTFSDYLS